MKKNTVKLQTLRSCAWFLAATLSGSCLAKPVADTVEPVTAKPAEQESLDIAAAAAALDYGIAAAGRPEDLQAVFELVDQQTETAVEQELYMAFLAQRLGIMLMEKDRESAQHFLTECVAHSEEIDESETQAAEALAISSMCYGLRIGLTPLQAPMLGSLSVAAMDSALVLGPDNPHVLFLAGMKDHFTLPMWGGSNVRAKERFIKSLEIAEQDDRWQWLTSDLFAYLALVEIKLNQPCEARRYYENALRIEPDSGLVKHVVKKNMENVTCDRELVGSDT